MVTFLCGKGGCTVMTENILDKPQTTYKPRCLSPLPRKRCAFIYQRHVTRYGSKQDMYVVPAPCTSKPLKNGWCATHQYIQAFLEEGARIGYPRLRVNDGLWIGEGIASWEAYAEHYSQKRMQEVLQAIKRWKTVEDSEKHGESK